MPASDAEFSRIGVVGKPTYRGIAEPIKELRRIADERDLQLATGQPLRELIPEAAAFHAEELDLLITFGGDGTLLDGARLVAPYHTPVLGVNLGHLGFLTSAPALDFPRCLERLFAGDYLLDVRFTMEAQVYEPGAEEPSGPSHMALNDAVVHQQGANLANVAISFGEDREEVGTYRADGVILSTPTGSTAYSLAAGGPIVVPSVDCILATPISPHSLTLRPLVIPADTLITLEVLAPTRQVVLTVDGKEGPGLNAGDRVVVRKGRSTVRLVRFLGQSFLSTLRRKLHWGLEPTYRDAEPHTGGE